MSSTNSRRLESGLAQLIATVQDGGANVVVISVVVKSSGDTDPEPAQVMAELTAVTTSFLEANINKSVFDTTKVYIGSLDEEVTRAEVDAVFRAVFLEMGLVTKAPVKAGETPTIAGDLSSASGCIVSLALVAVSVLFNTRN
jgi:hypothetical protein